jgi:hypothetical protein
VLLRETGRSIVDRVAGTIAAAGVAYVTAS